MAPKVSKTSCFASGNSLFIRSVSDSTSIVLVNPVSNIPVKINSAVNVNFDFMIIYFKSL